jgi:hypothetical protein
MKPSSQLMGRLVKLAKLLLHGVHPCFHRSALVNRAEELPTDLLFVAYIMMTATEELGRNLLMIAHRFRRWKVA